MIFLPDLYHLATLAEQNDSFFYKTLLDKFIYCVFYVKITATKKFTSFTWQVGDIERIQDFSFAAATLVSAGLLSALFNHPLTGIKI